MHAAVQYSARWAVKCRQSASQCDPVLACPVMILGRLVTTHAILVQHRPFLC